jgi:hypothetical protein
MFSAAPETAAATPPIIIDPEAARVLTKRRLAELDRLRGVCMAKVRSLDAVGNDLAASPDLRFQALAGSKGIILALERVTRSFRQIVVLEFELLGLFNAPDRDAIRQPRLPKVHLDTLTELDLIDPNTLIDLDSVYLSTRLDYRTGPMEEVVAGIRKTLGAEAPADDPFAPLAECAPAETPVPPRDRTASPRPAIKRKPGMQVKPVIKAKAPALPRKGFRVKPTSPHNPNTPSGARKGRHNRGPPR